MTELSPRARALIAAANEQECADPTSRLRGAERLQRALAGAGALGAGVLASASAEAASGLGASPSAGIAPSGSALSAAGSAGTTSIAATSTAATSGAATSTVVASSAATSAATCAGATVAKTAILGAASSGAAAAGSTLAGVGAKVVLSVALGFAGAGITHQAVELATAPPLESQPVAARTEGAGASSPTSVSPRAASSTLAGHESLREDAEAALADDNTEAASTELSPARRAAPADDNTEVESAELSPARRASSPATEPGEAVRPSPASRARTSRQPDASEPTSASRSAVTSSPASRPAPGANAGARESLRDEVRLLSRAERLLAEGRADEARALLEAEAGTDVTDATGRVKGAEPVKGAERAESAGPTRVQGSPSALHIERRALRIVAGCRSSAPAQRELAFERARAFVRDYGETPLAERVRAECQKK